ncbi:TetR/AcrR family transcriptional regulator [Mumia sp. Pv 4-285]|uniref:TetR/AcrR family transcriptional regulator n=1 Tax=Mumia qirimensis TaxID=3234852 RepID=UPI00351D6308
MDERPRVAILQAARQIVHESGWSALTVRAVAGRAEIGIGTLRHHFPTQAELHATVATMLTEDWRLDVDMLDLDAPPDEALLGFVRALVPSTETDRATLVAWAVRHAAAYGPSEAVAQSTELAREYGSLRTELRLVLRLFERRGQLRSGLSPDDMNTMIVALAAGFRLLLLTEDRGVTDESVERIVRHLAHHVVVT